MTSKQRGAAALLLDEMFAPAIAVELRRRGYDVISVAEDLLLRSMSDAELCQWAMNHGRYIVTENVKDFKRIASTGGRGPGLIFTSSRAFPRGRQTIGLLISALDAWLEEDVVRPDQFWLRRVGPRKRGR